MKRQTFNIISKKSLSEPSKSTKMISGGFIVDREPIISNGYISTYIDPPNYGESDMLVKPHILNKTLKKVNKEYKEDYINE